MQQTKQYQQAELSLCLAMIESTRQWYEQEKQQVADLQRTYVCMTLEHLFVWPLARAWVMWSIAFGAPASRYVDHHSAYTRFVYQLEAVDRQIKRRERDILEFKKQFTELAQTAKNLQIQCQSAQQDGC